NTNASIIYYFLIENFDNELDQRYLELDHLNGIIKIKGNNEFDSKKGGFKILVFDKNSFTVKFEKIKKKIFIDTPKNETWKLQNIIQQQIKENLGSINNDYTSNPSNKNVNLIAIQLDFNIS